MTDTTQQEREALKLYVECRECSDCGHVGLNDASDTEDSCSHCGWSGPAPKEDKCPGCEVEGAMCSACPKCGGRYVFVADGSFATPQGAEPVEVAGAVTVPMNADQAALMCLLGEQWLREHAPERELQADAKDAARYRLLRNSANPPGIHCVVRDKKGYAWAFGEALDERVDAELARQEGSAA